MHGNRSDLSLCRSEADGRDVYAFLCESLWNGNGLPAILQYIRPAQDPDSPYSGVLARFITAMLSGEAPVILGDGEQTRDFTYVDNAVSANLLAAVAPAKEVAGECFNIGTAQRISLNLTVDLLREIIGYSGTIHYSSARGGDVRHSLADISKAGGALGYFPLVSFKDGLKSTVEWYRTRQENRQRQCA
jgi:UDP-glucose 4-epimerase